MEVREMFASAHEYISKLNCNETLRLLPHRDPNEMCRYCKNEDTDVAQELYILNAYKEFFNKRSVTEYKVFRCHCCGVVSSWYKLNK